MIQLYDRVIPNAALQTLAALGIMVVGAIFAELLLRNARQRLLALAGEEFEQTMYKLAMKGLLKAKPGVVRERSQGDLQGGFEAIDRLREYYSGPTVGAALDLPFTGVFLLIMYLIAPVMALIVFVMLAAVFLVLRVLRTAVSGPQKARRKIEAQRHSFLVEVLRGMDSVRALQLSQPLLRRYERLMARSAHRSEQMVRGNDFVQGVAASVAMLMPILVCTIGAFMVIDGRMSLGATAALVLLSGRTIQPVLQFESYLAGSDAIQSARSDLKALLDQPQQSEGVGFLHKINSISLRDVTSAPEPETGIRFNEVSFDAQVGECILVTAPRPDQTSAFLRLLASEGHVEAGYRSINDHPEENYRRQDRLAKIRILSAEASLIDGTILENITNFRPDLYRERALELSRTLGLDAFLAQTSQGYYTPTGSGKLPRAMEDIVLLIAALVTDPDVILFDQANASLDRSSDASLLGLLQARLPECILVFVTARPSYKALATRNFDLREYLEQVTVDPAQAA